MKFEKITRAASEFIILSILMEKNNSHPYEIHQILQDRIEQHQQYQLDSLQTLIKYGEILNEGLDEENKSNLIEEIDSPTIRNFLKIIFKERKNSKEIKRNFTTLLQDAKLILEQKRTELEAWQKAPAIYQVLNNLEKRKLIRSSGTEPYKNRTRKLYEITKKGIKEAFNMLTTFGDLNQLIIPMTKVFQNHINFQMNNHITMALRLLKQLHPNMELSEIFKQIEDQDPDFLLNISNIFPILDNDSLFIPLLFDDLLSSDQIETYDEEQQLLFRKIMVKKLKLYRSKIDNIINDLEE